MVAPVIQLNGREIGGRLVRGSARAALSSVRIDWGRESLFDRPRPGVATVHIVNHGLNTDPPRKGESLLISHPDRGILFRGRVVEAPTSAKRTVRLANGLREEVTVTKVTAHDAIAAFAQFIPTGPSTGPQSGMTPGFNIEGYGGWRIAQSATRIAQVRDAGAGRLVDGWLIPTSAVQTAPDVWATCAPLAPSDQSALDLLHDTYAASRPLSTFTYNSANGQVSAFHHAAPATSVVTLQSGPAGALAIVPAEGVPTLPASHVRLEDTELRAPAEDIAEVRIEWMKPKSVDVNNTSWIIEWHEGATSAPVLGANAGSTYTCPHRQHIDEIETGINLNNSRYLGWWLSLAVERFRALNGIRSLPALIIDPEDAALEGNVIAWRTYGTTSSVAYLAGSMFNGEGAPSVVQFIGGTLTYDDKGRWAHKLTAAPTAGGAPAVLTLDQMFPASSTDTLDRWDENLTINDLAAATRRA